MLNNEVHYFHIRLDKMPVACLALQVNEGQTHALFGLSVHNPKDTYSRKMGRQVALGRLHKATVAIPIPVKSYSHIRYNILSSFKGDPTYGHTKDGQPKRLPARVLEAFKQYVTSYLDERRRRELEDMARITETGG